MFLYKHTEYILGHTNIPHIYYDTLSRDRFVSLIALVVYSFDFHLLFRLFFLSIISHFKCNGMQKI